MTVSDQPFVFPEPNMLSIVTEIPYSVTSVKTPAPCVRREVVVFKPSGKVWVHRLEIIYPNMSIRYGRVLYILSVSGLDRQFE
jgi:hypothetical protein